MFYYTDFVVAAVVVPDFNVIAGNSKHFLWPNNLLLSLFRLPLPLLLLLLLATLNVCLIISRMPFSYSRTKLNSNSDLICMYFSCTKKLIIFYAASYLWMSMIIWAKYSINNCEYY